MILNQLIVGPVGWHGHVILVGNLEGFEYSQDFRNIATNFSRVIENQPDNGFWINDENSSDRLGTTAWMDHANLHRNFAQVVGNDRERNFHFEFILDPFYPFDVAENLIN